MKSPELPASFLRSPIAHRGLHDRSIGVLENSRAAVAAAVEAGYGIEIDVQKSRDGVAMVFHDATLRRMTGRRGRIDEHSAVELGEIDLSGGSETIPTLAEVLDIVDGRAPLLVELKDTDELLEETDAVLEQGVARALQDYSGDMALMSFNPHSVAHLAEMAPDRARGLTTCDFVGPSWPQPDYRRAELAGITDFDRVGASFVSHNRAQLTNPGLSDLRRRGAPVLCWTVRSVEQEKSARKLSDNITFEAYHAALPD